MLEMSNIHKYFGDVRVLNGVNLRLEKGFVYTLKGGNGSGKATLINIISGFLAPTKGIVKFKGNYDNILLTLETKLFANSSKEQ
jgi:ABC-type sugar transport system ATPase subunit